ncbi:MAG: peptidoglycan DD-metalloendopeptidase family protein [Patescibacteria group bacterium]
MLGRFPFRSTLIRLAAVVTLALVPLGTAAPAEAADGYQFPCSPYKLSGYNFGQHVSGWGYHAGQDIACSSGTPVYAIADGKVVYSALTPDSWRWGNLIMIEHANPNGSKATSIYGHLSNNRRVAAGQRVSKGQHIGAIGPSNTRENGRWGDHLHFAVHLGAYGASTGTYWSAIHGYEPASKIGRYAHPGKYITSRQNYYSYQYVGQNGGGSKARTEEHYVEFRLKNTGQATWRSSGSNAVRLGTERPRDRGSTFSRGMGGHGWHAPNRISLQSDTPPGQVGVFRARFNNSYVSPGNHREYFTPVVEGISWMRNIGMYTGIRVQGYNYRAQWYGQSAHLELSPTSRQTTNHHRYLAAGKKVNLKAYIKNTGDYSWHAGGKHPVRLGTSRSIDRKSRFATTKRDGVPDGEQWISGSRATGLNGRLDPSTNKVVGDSTIEPGQIGVFSFTIKAPGTPGTYREYFRPVLEGNRWLDDFGMYFELRVLPHGFHYEWVKQENPEPVAYEHGDATTRVYLRNTGQAAWPTGGNVRLGTDRSRDRKSAFKGGDWLAANRASTIDEVADAPGERVVDPGQVARFDFKVESKVKPDGGYKEYFRPVAEGKAWFPEDYGMYVPVHVESPPYGYSVLDQRFSKDPSDAKYGEVIEAVLQVKNLGSNPWPADGTNAVRLGTFRPQDRQSGFGTVGGSAGWINASRAARISGKVDTDGTVQSASEINQGEVAQFKVPLRIDSALDPGSYKEYFNLVHEGKAWMPDLGIYFPVTITSANYDYEVLDKRYSRDPRQLSEDDEVEVRVAVRNTGRYAWPVSGSNAGRRGTERPQDRSSAFRTTTGSDPWLAANRASGIDGKVTDLATLATVPATGIKPGEVALLKFTLTANKLGSHQEYFSLVQEGVTWFPDHGLMISLNITAPAGINDPDASPSPSPAP